MGAFAASGAHVIAEVKLASPSEGDIAAELDPVQVAGEYLKNGATALSVLTEEDYFKGCLQYLKDIRRAYPKALLLRKDFIVDEYQLFEARAAGADAALLIVALLDDTQLRALLSTCAALQLSPLVEVHDEMEMKRALQAGARLIGVNNRDLKSLKVDLQTSRRLATLPPAGSVLIAESGFTQGSELKEFSALGYRGFLIGTHFMRGGRPGSALAALLREAKSS
jgi:indole-3-glycerol phosphate synthase